MDGQNAPTPAMFSSVGAILGVRRVEVMIDSSNFVPSDGRQDGLGKPLLPPLAAEESLAEVYLTS